MGDINVLDFLPVEAGAFYVMDRGYLDFARLYKLHQTGAFFVTRAKSNMNAGRVYSIATDRCTGVICDQAVAMNGFYASRNYPEHVTYVLIAIVKEELQLHASLYTLLQILSVSVLPAERETNEFFGPHADEFPRFTA